VLVLVRAQHRERVQARRTSRRQVRRQRADRDQQEWRAQERNRVEGLDLEQQAAQQWSGSERAKKADRGAGPSDAQALREHEAAHVGRACAEGHSHAELKVALAHRRSEHGVDADRRQQQRREPEAGDGSRTMRASASTGAKLRSASILAPTTNCSAGR
jgi:hypothetical protein